MLLFLSISDCLLLACRKANIFGILFLYPVTLLDSLIVIVYFLKILYIFYLGDTVTAKADNFTFVLRNQTSFFDVC